MTIGRILVDDNFLGRCEKKYPRRGKKELTYDLFGEL
jgi:hypothetical protein